MDGAHPDRFLHRRGSNAIGARWLRSGCARLGLDARLMRPIGQCTMVGTRAGRPARRARTWAIYRCRSGGHGGPRHDAGNVALLCGRRGGSTCSVSQCPVLQCGQQSISMAATRRMKACAPSRACELGAGMANAGEHAPGARSWPPVPAARNGGWRFSGAYSDVGLDAIIELVHKPL